MKPHVLLLTILSAGVVLALTGCGAAGKAEPPEPGTAPLEITAFSFHHTASVATDCFRLTLTREEDGTVAFCAEELFLNGRMAEGQAEPSVLARLEEAAGAFRMELWDGFDASARVSDGSAFRLEAVLADGTTVTAAGDNRFPHYYSELYSVVRALCGELLEPAAEGEGEDASS